MKFIARASLFIVLLISLPLLYIVGEARAQLSDIEETKRLDNLVIQLSRQGRYAEAEKFCKHVLEIREKVLGPEHPDVALSLNNLAVLYHNMGNSAAAEPLLKRSLAINEKVLGIDHPVLATSLNNIAVLYQNMGNYSAAELCYKRSLTINEKALGPEHSKVATVLKNLGELYRVMGNLTAAEPLCKRSLAINEKALGPEHPEVAESLKYLILIYFDMGNYSIAEPLCKRSLAINEKALGPEHPEVATSLNNLALLYNYTGNYTAAEPLLKRSLAIKEKNLGLDHPVLATSLNNIAVLYHNMGNYSAAEILWKRSLAINEKALGPEHTIVATNLNNLAINYYRMENFAVVEPLLNRSLAIREKVLGPEHPQVANSLNCLAILYQDIGNYSASESFYSRSLAIYEKTLGPEHPEVALVLYNFSILSATQGRYIEGLEKITRSQRIYDGMIEHIAGFSTGESTIKYLSTIQSGTDRCLNLVNSFMKEDALARREAFSVWLRRKGLVLEAQRRMQQALLAAGDREADKVFNELSQTRVMLAELYFSGSGETGGETYLKRLKDLNSKKDELESKLSRLSLSFAEARKVMKATIEQVASSLPQGAVLVDFARINIFNFKAKTYKEKRLPARYFAFVLQPGKGKDVALLDLGLADDIDITLDQFKNALTQNQEAKAKDLSYKLYSLVFFPIQKEIGAAELIFLSPDGLLNLLPFEILKDFEGNYLIEKYTFNYLTTGRDLLGFSEKKENPEKPLLIGDPDFDLGSSEKSQVLRRLGIQVDNAFSANRSVEHRSLHFNRLEETGKEVIAIRSLLGSEQCLVFLDNSALEEVLQSHKAPRILHLATHGFFLKDQELSGIGDTVSFASTGKPFSDPRSQKVSIENPLLRSGLALAGANRGGSVAKGNDGILTADEVLGLKLRGTELVVLSACETGLGEVKTGEGVFGLRRAFTQAGALSLVMSMWKIPDEPTKDLMVEFYRNILSGKFDRCQSLRQAVLKIKRKYGDNPMYWGAFVFLGQPS